MYCAFLGFTVRLLSVAMAMGSFIQLQGRGGGHFEVLHGMITSGMSD